MVIQESYPVQADDMTAAGDVSARIKRHMKRLGVPAAVMRRVSVCTYEAEINLVIHSDGRSTLKSPRIESRCAPATSAPASRISTRR